jgi:hypothetical protein
MIDPDKVYHVYPTNDSEDHYLECVYPTVGDPYCPCECKPVLKEVEGGWIIVHNSFDGREGVEWVNELLNKNE